MCVLGFCFALCSLFGLDRKKDQILSGGFCSFEVVDEVSFI